MKRDVLNSPRLLELKKSRRRSILNKILFFFFGLFALFFFLAYLSRLNSLNITEIQIEGNKIVETEILKKTVEEQTAGKYFWLFPKTNILYYPQNTIKNELQDKFKRIKDVSLSIINNKTLIVSLKERTAEYTWCGSRPSPSPKEEKCYFLDADGYVFDEAPYFSGDVYFKFYGMTNLISVNNPLGSYFSKLNFKQLTFFEKAVENMGLKPILFYLKDDGNIEIFLSSDNALLASPQIILNKDSDFEKVAENLQAALITEPLKSNLKNKYSSLLYIDLRFKNKVYDKFQ